MMMVTKKTTKKKRDLIPTAFYQIMSMKYEELRKLQKELEEHLERNYIIKKDFEKNWDFQSLISDCLYGDESETPEFIKDLNKKAKRK